MVTLTIAEIKQPAEGKDRGSIIGTDGKKFGCFREKLHLFQIGQTYEIEVTDGQYANVKSAKLTAASPAAQPAAAPSAPAASGHSNGNGYGQHYRQTDPVDAERMFVTKLLGDAITSGAVKFDKQELWSATQMLRGLWKHTFAFDGQVFTPSEAGRKHLVAAE